MKLGLFGFCFPILILSSCVIAHGADDGPLLHCYLSTGDNQWLGQSLPIDSPASIEASFDLLHRLGVKRVYWRGLEAATWVEGHRERPESVRYYEFWKWLRWLYENVEPDRLAVEAAHQRGMEIWGVGNLVDWGASADTPPFKHYPFNSESRLRIENPEWIPTDKSGLLRAGRTDRVGLPRSPARPDRSAHEVHEAGRLRWNDLPDLCREPLHAVSARIWLQRSPSSSSSNGGTRSISRHEAWARFATPDDWQDAQRRACHPVPSRAENVSSSRERSASSASSCNRGIPHRPQPWNVPELLLNRCGSMHFRSGDMDRRRTGRRLPRLRLREPRHPGAATVRNMRWMTRGHAGQQSAF